MSTKITRRNFLKLLVGFSALHALNHTRLDSFAQVGTSARTGTGAGKPNILVLVYDTLSAEHMSVYGYPRDTTPNLARFAQHSTVFHRHNAAGNFTTPGTASLLTGVYPWSHRAFNIGATVDPYYSTRNLFSIFAGAGYHRQAYTHNWLVEYFLQQFKGDIEQHLKPDTYFLKGTPDPGKLLRSDAATAYRSGNFISRVLLSEKVLPSSLFLSLINEFGLEQYEATLAEPELAKQFPDGFPEESNSKSFFLLEDAIDGLIDRIKNSPQPSLTYFHLYPPHHPYHPRREFIGRFRDDWAPAGKPEHYFSSGQTNQDLNERRVQYDEYLAYADSEFGRLYEYMRQAGILDTTWVVFTSDHGEMFERGIKGHNTPVLYDPLVRVPLLVHQPGQSTRVDVHTSTSCVDVLPTLALAAGQPMPDWCEGRPLPIFPDHPGDPERPIYALDARRNAKYRPIETGTVVMVKNRRKFIAYYGYRGFDRQYELFDMESDPQEMVDLSRTDALGTNSFKSELENTLSDINRGSRGNHVS